MRYRPKLHQYVALVLLLIAGIIYLKRPVPIDMRQWIPLSVPIQLKVGEVHTPVFLAGLDTSYALFIESERTIKFERLECFLGMATWQRDRTCADAPDMIDIDWSVLHDGQVVATGSSRDSSGGFYSGTIARQIGKFPAQKGRQYSIALDIRRDGGELNATRPKLLVQTYPGEWKDAVVGYMLVSELRNLGIAAFGASAVLTLALTPLVGYLRRRYKRSKQSQL